MASHGFVYDFAFAHFTLMNTIKRVRIESTVYLFYR